MTPEQQKKLAQLDSDIRAKQKELVELLRETTDNGPVAEFTFDTPDGSVTLRELFGDRDDLIVVHNMGASCPYCTLWADEFNGALDHIENRTAFAVVSPDAVTTQQAFREKRGWQFRMASDASGFAEAMGYRWEQDGKPYNMPGFSTFKRDGDVVTRVGHAPFGPGDAYCGVWHFFDMLDGGAKSWGPKFKYD